MNLWFAPSFVTFVCSISLIVVVFRRDPRSPISRHFALTLAMITWWALGSTLAKLTTNPDVALVVYKIFAPGWILIGGAFLNFSMIYSGRRGVLGRKAFYFLLYGPGIILSGLFLATDFFICGVTSSHWGFLPLNTRFSLIPVLYSATCMVPSFPLLFRAMTERQWELDRKQASLVLLGGIIGWYGLMIMGAVPWLFSLRMPELSAVPLLSAMFLISLAILKYKLFELPPLSRFFVPMPEDYLPSRVKYELTPRACCFVVEKEPRRSAEIFLDLVRHGIPGIWITSRDARGTRAKFGLRRTPVLILNKRRIRGEATLVVTKLSRAKAALKNYASAVFGRAVVFFDGFRGIVESNGFEEALEFSRWLRRFCREEGFYLIVRADPREFTPERVEVIKRALGARKNQE